jgi:multidrug efflux system outer membrane protein
VKAKVAVLLLAALLGGCVSLAPDYQRPEAELPAAWKPGPPAEQSVVKDRWWTMFERADLDRLVDEALAHNQDLKLAVARVAEARGIARSANGERYPSVDISGQRDRTRLSERGPTRLPVGTELTNNDHQLYLNAAFEIDFWSRLKNASEAAQAQLLATEAARETVRISLTAQVVQSYFALVAFDAQIAATQRTIDLRQADYELQKTRYRTGLIGAFDLRQREAEVAAARVVLPTLQRSRDAEEAALTVLLGRSPRAIMESAVTPAAGSDAAPPVVVPEGLPSDLLRRRPDVVAAEQQLIATNFQIGVAKASLFPRFTLTGYLGSESTTFSNWFSGPAAAWQVALGLAQPVFQGGRLFGEVDAAEARQQQAVAQYQKAVQNAFRDVRQALSAQRRSREIFDVESTRVRSLEETLRLARVRYDLGISSQLEVLDAERNLLAAELNRTGALRDQRVAIADLVKALGGGWEGLPTEGEGPVAQAR